MLLNNYYFKFSTIPWCIQLTTNNDSRWNDYYNRQSKIKMKNNCYKPRMIFMKANKLFVYKIIISDDRGNHSPTHFAKTRMTHYIS